MGRRLQLHSLLKTVMLSPVDGNPPLGKVYFQPETNINIEYPCIIYAQDQSRNKFADNVPYTHIKRWQVEIIDTNADSDLPDKVAALAMTAFQRGFVTAGLYHKIYSLYF